MKKYIWALVVILFSFGYVSAYNVTLSDKAEVSLLTCEPGDKVYEKFGHTGIRVSDPANGIDLVFHWGIFSFESPNFVGRFVSGRPIYEMGIFRTSFFLKEYRRRESTVHSQLINYSQEQKQSLWDELMKNYETENRYYKYNFIYDNCATRPYHMIIKEFGTSARYDFSQRETTFRDLINKHVTINSWLNTGINMIIGSDADKHIGTLNTISFPIFTMDALNKCYFEKNDELHKMVENSSTIYQAPKKVATASWIYNLNMLFPILLIIAMSIYYWRKKHYIPYLTQLILIVSGLISIVIMFLWFCSEHPLVDDNFNLLWLNPINLVLGIWMFFRHKNIRIKSILSVISLILSLFFVIIVMFNIQSSTGMLLCIYILMITSLTTIVMTYSHALHSFSHKNHHKNTNHKNNHHQSVSHSK